MNRAGATLWLIVMALAWAGVIALVLLVSGCATAARFDPVQRPPKEYQKPTTVAVQFVPPEATALRCFERGALYPANACANTQLITMPNPCAFEEPYARILCHEVAHTQGWKH